MINFNIVHKLFLAVYRKYFHMTSDLISINIMAIIKVFSPEANCFLIANCKTKLLGLTENQKQSPRCRITGDPSNNLIKQISFLGLFLYHTFLICFVILNKKIGS